MPIQGCGVARYRRLFWWSRIPNDIRGRSRILCPTPEVQLDYFYITLVSWEFLLNRYNFL